MIMRIQFLMLLFLANLFFLGCQKEDVTTQPLPEVEEDYIVFGQFFGLCLGEKCVEIFKIENEKLFEDTADQYPMINSESPYQGNYIELSQTLYERVSNVKDFFPEELLNETALVIGTPDVTDGGGYYVSIKENGEERHWRIDAIRNNIPAYLHAFTDKIDEAVSSINN